MSLSFEASREMLVAMRQKDYEAVLRLLARGEGRSAEGGYDPELLLWAAECGGVEVARFLLNNGADINCRSAVNSTPLMKAVSEGYADIVRLLVEREADVNLVNEFGYTALSEAQDFQEFDQGEIVALLLAAGALEDISQTPDGQRWARESAQRHERDLERARQEFASQSANHGTAKSWAGAWADAEGQGFAAYVYHADGRVLCSYEDHLTLHGHLQEAEDGTLSVTPLYGDARQVSVSGNGQQLSLHTGTSVITYVRL